MEPSKAARELTREIIDYYRLPEQICFDFIHQRIQWAMAIGFDLHRATLNKGKMVVQMNMHGRTLRVFVTGKDASKALDIPPSHISEVCRGERKSAGGYTWRFLDPNEYYNYIKRK